MRDLADDFYDFDEKNYTLVGRRKGNRYRLGDAVRVKVARCDIQKKQLDFVIVDETGEPVGATLRSTQGKKHTAAPAKSKHSGKGRRRK